MIMFINVKKSKFSKKIKNFKKELTVSKKKLTTKMKIFKQLSQFLKKYFAQAGEGERNLANRIRNYLTITKKLRLRRSKTVLERKKNSLSIVEKKYPLDFDDFDCTFWFGDLNFR